MVSNFQSVFLYNSSNMKRMEQENISEHKSTDWEQSTVLDGSNVNEFYNNQVLNYEESWIENFTSKETGTGAETDHCIKLYLNVAKYKPLQGSSYILLPKALANKKATINVKNEDNECLRWALFSALYPDDSHHKNEKSGYRTYEGCSKISRLLL